MKYLDDTGPDDTLCKCCMQFYSLYNLQNALHDLATVRVQVRFRLEICKLHMHNFKIAMCILQTTAQTDKSCAAEIQILPCTQLHITCFMYQIIIRHY